MAGIVSSTETIEKPVDDSLHAGESWTVIVYDNDHNTVEEVLMILMIATHCTLEEAEIETWEVHNLGKSVVHHGGEAECNEVAAVIRQIGIRVEVISE